MKTVRRKVSTIPILEPGEMIKICERAENSRDACLVALLYLCGRRIEEVLGLKKEDFTATDNILSFETFNEKSFRKDRRSPFVIERRGLFYEEIRPRFSLSSVSGSKLGHYVTDYLESLKEGDYLFHPFRCYNKRTNINRSRAYQIVRKMDERLWLHAMRHINFTRMAGVYMDDPVAMHRLTFHKQFKSTLEYIHEKETKERMEKI